VSERARTVLFWVVLLAILVAVNWQIARKQATLRDGRTVLLELAPRDPRSLIQGNYMDLRYEIAADPRLASAVENLAGGTLVLRMDERGIASFARLDDGGALAPEEALLRFRNRGSFNGVRLGAESFFFEEGQAERYASAKYGELRVDASGTGILVGLRDEDLRPL
jgi:uncharacterized membrane-anchored protein